MFFHLLGIMLYIYNSVSFLSMDFLYYYKLKVDIFKGFIIFCETIIAQFIKHDLRTLIFLIFVYFSVAINLFCIQLFVCVEYFCRLDPQTFLLRFGIFPFWQQSESTTLAQLC